MRDLRPGLNAARLVNLMAAAVERCGLDLSGATVLTEAASGAYAVTPVLAAMAGARHVYALTRATRYGSAEEVTAETLALAGLAGVESRVTVTTQRRPETVALADIVTNSGHVRPMAGEFVTWMKPTVVVPLMYEAWEYRPGDLDLAALAERGIPVGGTNERHPAVDVFSFLGIMAVKLLLDAGVAVYGSDVVVLCDNPFGPFIERGLAGAGATVELCARLEQARGGGRRDAVLVALRPGLAPVLAADEADTIARRWPGAVVAQYWGDVDRTALAAAGVSSWPPEAPAAGHMGVLPSGVGPEPIVRLQSGGLKVGEVLWRARRAGLSTASSLDALARSGWGEALDAADRSLVEVRHAR
jgi:hypothetical protein